jgi:flavin-binding protein dodecin
MTSAGLFFKATQGAALGHTLLVTMSLAACWRQSPHSGEGSRPDRHPTLPHGARRRGRAAVRRPELTSTRLGVRSRAFASPAGRRQHMAKKQVDTGVYRVTEVIGTSKTSWEDATKNAVETAAKSLRDLRIAEVSKLDVKIEGGKVVAYRARVSLSFKYDG